MSENQPPSPPRPQPPAAAFLAITFVFIAGLVLGFVLGRTL